MEEFKGALGLIRTGDCLHSWKEGSAVVLIVEECHPMVGQAVERTGNLEAKLFDMGGIELEPRPVGFLNALQGLQNRSQSPPKLEAKLQLAYVAVAIAFERWE